MYIKQCEGCVYYRDLNLGNKHLLGSRWSGYCSYYPRTSRGQLRSISRIVDCKAYCPTTPTRCDRESTRIGL